MLDWLRWCRRTARRGWRAAVRRLRDGLRPPKPAKRPVAKSVEAVARAATPPLTTRVVRTDQDLIEEVRAKIDLARWNGLRDEWASQEGRAFNPAYLKYFDLDRWFPQAVSLARRAGLMEGERKHVLDIGCGSGLFGRVCVHYGHEFVGLDVGNPMFMAMCEALGVRCIVGLIERHQPLPADLHGFDVITTISPKFYLSEKIDGKQHLYAWDDGDWGYFLADLRSRLVPDGIYLSRFSTMENLAPSVIELTERARRIDRGTFVFARSDLPG